MSFFGKQARMYYGSGIRANDVTLGGLEAFLRNDVMATILKVWRQIRNPTVSIDFTRGTILPSFVPIRFETTKL